MFEYSTKVFGSSGYNPEAEAYALMTDGEMGPYPLSDNTNLLSSTSNYGIQLYRNYGSNYGTNYNSSYVYPTRVRYNSGGCDSQQCTLSNCSAMVGGGGGGGGCTNSTGCGSRISTQTCDYDGECSAERMQSKTPVPTRRHSTKRERDSFRRHSAHGRISSQGIYSIILFIIQIPIDSFLSCILYI